MAEMVIKKCNGCGETKPAWKSRASYCTDCCRQHNRDWELRHPDKVKARVKQKAHDPEHQQKTSTYRKIRRRISPEVRAKEIAAHRKQHLKAKYGLTVEQVEAMRKAQGGLCAICFRSPTVKRLGRVRDLSVDHDHTTGAVRALLCYHCNTGLGQFKDSIATLWQAIRYLREHEKTWATATPESL